jgi:uncharacterized protein
VSVIEVLLALVIAAGIVGIVVPVLPGSLLVVGAVLVWTLEVGSSRAWIVFAVAITFVVCGTIAKYLLPGRRLKAAGVPSSTLATGAVLGFVGFFAIPVVGLLLGFVAGVYLAERRRVGATLAWPSTRSAFTAVGLSILIDMAAAVLAALTWLAGVFVIT